MRNTEYIDIERRGFALNDIAQVPDSLLAACTADDAIADAWDEGVFEDMFVDEACSLQASLWHKARDLSMAHLHRQSWRLAIERNAS